MPMIDYLSNAPPSIFAYPLALVDKKEEKKEKVEAAVLSITVKQKKRDLEKNPNDTTPMEIVGLFISKQKSFIVYLINLRNQLLLWSIKQKKKKILNYFKIQHV